MLPIFSQLFVPGAILPTHPDTSNDRPARANGGAVAQTQPVRTSVEVEARFRRWFRCPPLCQRGGLKPAQLRVPAPRDSLTLPHFSDKIPALASGSEQRSLTKSHSPRSLGVWRRCQNSSHSGIILQRPSLAFVRDGLPSGAARRD